MVALADHHAGEVGEELVDSAVDPGTGHLVACLVVSDAADGADAFVQQPRLYRLRLHLSQSPGALAERNFEFARGLFAAIDALAFHSAHGAAAVGIGAALITTFRHRAAIPRQGLGLGGGWSGVLMLV